MLGMRIDSAYKDQILKSVAGHMAAQKRRKARWQETYEEPFDQDEHFAYIAGYTAAGFAYGVTWEVWERLNQADLIDPNGGSNNTSNDDPQELPF